MHLTDDQLLEHDEFAETHLLSCEICKQRANQLLNIRLKLSDLPIIAQSQNNWQSIQKLHFERQLQSDLKQSQQKIKFWRLGSLALAASLAIVVLWPNLQSSNQADFNQSNQLAVLIEQNNLLQQQLLQKQNTNHLVNFNDGYLEFELSQLDQRIQKAYLEQSNDAHKKALWSERQELIKKSLSDHKQNKTITI